MMQKHENDWILFAHPEKCFVYYRKSFGNAVIFSGISPSGAYESDPNTFKSLITELEAPSDFFAIEISNKIEDLLNSLKTHPRGIKFRVHWLLNNDEFHLIVKEMDSWPIQYALTL